MELPTFFHAIMNNYKELKVFSNPSQMYIFNVSNA